MAKGVAIAAGSRWQLKRGQHAGSVVQIVRASDTSIKYRNLGGGKSTGSTPMDDEGRLHSRAREEFLTLFEPERTNGGSAATHSAWRRTYQPKEEPVIDEEPALAPPVPSKNGTYVNPGQSGLSISVETITPEMAANWLERSEDAPNRRPSERRILQLINAIQMGEWDLTGETIKLDAGGLLRDGKHRLTAITRAGVPVQCIVVRGIAEKAFDKIDTGKSRSAADVLGIHGHTSVTAKATAARGLILIERYGRLDAGGTRVGYNPAPTNAQILAYVEAHPEVAIGVHHGDRLRVNAGFFGGTGLWAIGLAMFHRISPEQTTVFVDSLIEGANLEPGSPILKLRNMYKGSAREWDATTQNRERLLACVIKGWNSWRRDELVQSITWHSRGRGAERFPTPE